jgi:hypothetical protein
MQRFQNEPINFGMKQNLRIFRPFLSNPLRQVLTNTKDPFSSLARPLLSEEYFLLDHCKFTDAIPDSYPVLTS